MSFTNNAGARHSVRGAAWLSTRSAGRGRDCLKRFFTRGWHRVLGDHLATVNLGRLSSPIGSPTFERRDGIIDQSPLILLPPFETAPADGPFPADGSRASARRGSADLMWRTGVTIGF